MVAEVMDGIDLVHADGDTAPDRVMANKDGCLESKQPQTSMSTQAVKSILLIALHSRRVNRQEADNSTYLPAIYLSPHI